MSNILNCGRGSGCDYATILNIVENRGQIRPQLQSQCNFGDFENHDVASTVAIVDRNLKPFMSSKQQTIRASVL